MFTDVYYRGTVPTIDEANKWLDDVRARRPDLPLRGFEVNGKFNGIGELIDYHVWAHFGDDSND